LLTHRAEFFVNKGADDWNWGMYGAAGGGHLDLVEFFVDKGAHCLNFAMSCAALEAHPALVEFFVRKKG
jgi:hypothetical protein